MPTGKFAADFSEFSSAVRSAEVELRSFESNSAKVESRLNAVSDAFSGRRIISEATIAVKAVNELGGATALTAAEQDKVNRLVTEAIAKYGVLGKEAPDDMRALADATKQTHEPAGVISTKMLALGTAIGQMAAEGVIALGKLAVDGIGQAATAFGDLVLEGATVSSISGNFEHLATAAGHVSATLLGELRAGTHATISDFDLMTVANAQLAAGLNLSDRQMSTLAQGAFNLAQATGGDVKSGLDAMSEAMVTGNAKSIALLTGKVDLESAERRYALSLGKTRDELTNDQQLYARQQAILEAVAAASARVGEQTDGIGERVQQAAARWDNFRQGLAKSIAESPVLAAGLEAIQTSLERAFGGNQEALIAAITKGINVTAIAAVDFGIGLVDLARAGIEAFGTLKTPIDVITVAITEVVARTASGIASMLELAAAVPGVGSAFEGSAEAARSASTAWGGLNDSAHEQLETDRALATGQGAVHGAIDTTVQMLGAAKAAMTQSALASKASGSAFADHAGAAGQSAAATQAAAAAAAAEEAALKRQEDALKAAAAAQKKMAEAMVELASVGEDWHATVTAIDAGVVAMAEAYLRAGASASTIATALSLTDAQVKAITKSIDEHDKAIDRSVKLQQEWAKGQLAAAQEARGLWDDYEKIRAAQSKTATDQQIAEVERWKRNLITKHQEAGDLTEDLYRAIEATAAAKLDAIRVDWSSLTTSSQTNLQQTADKALATYEEARTGHHNLTIEQIDNLQRIAQAAQDAANGYSTAFTGAATAVGEAMDGAADRAVAAAGRIATSSTPTGAISGAGAPPAGYSFNNPAALNYNMTPAQREARAKELGGVVNYDDYGNPYVYIPGVNAPGDLMPPATLIGGSRGMLGDIGGIPGRAAGGPVNAGGAYVVGERGPELFVPRTDGRIATGAGSISVVVHVSGALVGTTEQLARLVGDALIGRLRQQGVQLPASV